MSQPPRIALVVGSGSVKCAAALGLQRVLRREGIPVDLVVGCSGGSLYAACVALGIDVDESLRLTRTLWTHETTGETDRLALLRTVLPRAFGFSERWGLRRDRRAMQGLRAAFGERVFADARIPLFVSATDFHSGAQVVLSSGSLVDALRASIAIPFVFEPWPVGERLLVDGYLSDPLPVGVAIREGARVILAMGFDSPPQSRVNSAVRFAFQVSAIMTNNLLRAQYAFYSLAHHAEVLAIIPEFPERVHLFDTDKLEMIVAAGERAMEEQLPYLKRLLAAQA